MTNETAAVRVPSAEEQFKRLLEDFVDMHKKLTPFCKTHEEMQDLVQHGLDNEAQARLLLALVTAKEKR